MTNFYRPCPIIPPPLLGRQNRPKSGGIFGGAFSQKMLQAGSVKFPKIGGIFRGNYRGGSVFAPLTCSNFWFPEAEPKITWIKLRHGVFGLYVC